MKVSPEPQLGLSGTTGTLPLSSRQEKVGKLGKVKRQQGRFNLLQIFLSGRKGKYLLLENHLSVQEDKGTRAKRSLKKYRTEGGNIQTRNRPRLQQGQG